MRPIVVAVFASAWLGAALLFAASVAPAAFAVLPSRTLAAAVVGRVLPILFVSGVLVGLLPVVVDPLPLRRWRIAAGVTMAAACAIAQFLIAPRIARIRASISGPIDALATDDPRRLAFGRLHGLSVAWLAVAMLAAAVIVVATSRRT